MIVISVEAECGSQVGMQTSVSFLCHLMGIVCFCDASVMIAHLEFLSKWIMWVIFYPF